MKAAMNLIGVTVGDPYPPYGSLSKDEIGALAALLRTTVLAHNSQPPHPPEFRARNTFRPAGAGQRRPRRALPGISDMTLPKTGNSKLIDLARPGAEPSGALDQEARELLFALQARNPLHKRDSHYCLTTDGDSNHYVDPRLLEPRVSIHAGNSPTCGQPCKEDLFRREFQP